MDVAGEDVIGVGEDGGRAVGEDDLALRAHFPDEVAVISHVVDAGEGMAVLAEERAVLFEGEDVRVGIDPGFVERVEGNEFVAHLVGGVAQHQNHLLTSHGDTL